MSVSKTIYASKSFYFDSRCIFTWRKNSPTHWIWVVCICGYEWCRFVLQITHGLRYFVEVKVFIETNTNCTNLREIKEWWHEKANAIVTFPQPFQRQFHKMVKHTQTIRRQIADELSVFDHFVGLALKGLTRNYHWIYLLIIVFQKR